MILNDPCCKQGCSASARWQIDVQEKDIGTIISFSCIEHLPDMLDKSKDNVVRHITVFSKIKDLFKIYETQDSR